MERVIHKEESQAYDRGVYATLLGAFLVLFQIGIYFVYIPWNAERLQITEAEIGLGLLAFGLLNLVGNQTSGRLIVPKIGTKNSICNRSIRYFLLPIIFNLITKLFLVLGCLYAVRFFCGFI